MTHDKARELFSAYSEGTLDAGLTKALEQKMASDPHLAIEYAQFETTLQDLGLLKAIEVPVPDDLGERISARLDRHIWETKQKAAPAWSGWMRGLTFAGAAAVVLIGTVATLKSHGNGPTASSILGYSGAGDHVTLVRTDDGVHLRFAPASPKTLTIYTEPDHHVMTVLKVSGKMDAPLLNPNPTVGLLRIEVTGTNDASPTESLLVALPAKTVVPGARVSKTGSTIQDLAVALAGVYSIPVQLQVVDPLKPISWNFKGGDARTSASKALDGLNYSVDVRDNDFISIQSN